ncbi:hypothetical protein EF405_06585 [Cyclobacteriaceae bacterium YHN15]|nr:hypothetical protein EF405_06585 [Cyclobacteriaceae bacterium YHN15]
MISENTVLVLAGSARQIDKYNKAYQIPSQNSAPILILGGGRVGRATGRALAARNVDYRIIEKDPLRIKNHIDWHG